MNSCILGFHNWNYAPDDKRRWCAKCQKKQEKDSAGKWVESRVVEPPKADPNFCQCPRDYTISLKSMSCPRCGLPRPPRVMPTPKKNPSR